MVKYPTLTYSHETGFAEGDALAAGPDDEGSRASAEAVVAQKR
jgi:hypothetical protein